MVGSEKINEKDTQDQIHEEGNNVTKREKVKYGIHGIQEKGEKQVENKT
jgi:hypothetical protein